MKTLTRPRRILGGGVTMLLLAASASVTAQAPPAQGTAPSLGTLEYGPTLYYPQGCQHNGSTVVCTFVFVHQAEPTTIRAGVAGSQLTGIQFVDDAHVPHAANAAYFVDRYGARQHLMIVNRGDQGTMMVEFPLVDPRVGSGGFLLGAQVLGGIPVGQGAAAAAPMTPNALATGSGQAAQPANARLASATPQAATTPQSKTTQSNGCNTPQMANTSACKLSTKITSAETSATNTEAALAAPVNAVKQLGDTFSGLFKKVAPAAAPAAAPAPQATQQ